MHFGTFLYPLNTLFAYCLTTNRNFECSNVKKVLKRNKMIEWRKIITLRRPKILFYRWDEMNKIMYGVNHVVFQIMVFFYITLWVTRAVYYRFPLPRIISANI